MKDLIKEEIEQKYGKFVWKIIVKHYLNPRNSEDLKEAIRCYKKACFDYLYGDMQFILLKKDIENKINRELSMEEAKERIKAKKPSDIDRLYLIKVDNLSDEEYENIEKDKQKLFALKDVGYFDDNEEELDMINELYCGNLNRLYNKYIIIKNAIKRVNLENIGFENEMNKIEEQYLNNEHKK